MTAAVPSLTAGRLADASPERPQARRTPWPLRLLPTALTLAFLAYVFIGVMPMKDASAIASGDGNAVERMVVLGMAAIALFEIVRRRRVVLPLVVHSWPVWLVLGWFCASVSWAAFPDLTVRRVSVMVFVCVISLAIAAGVGSLRRSLALMVGMLVVAILGDFAATALNPAFAFTDLGVRGYHQQKNVAGLVAMLAVIATVGWTLCAPRPRRVFAGLAFTLIAFAFLILTKSKTSIMLAVLGVALLPCMLFLRRIGPAASLFIILTLTGIVGVAYLGVTAFDESFIALLTPGHDASFTGRTQIWDFAASEIARRPWTGYGFGSFWDVGDANDPLLRAPPGSWLATLKIGERAEVIINQAHNGYLDLQLQGGFPALVFAVLAEILTVLALAGKLFTRRLSRADAVAAATLLVIVLVVLVHNATESSLWYRGQVLANVTILISLLAFRREPA